MSIEGRCTQARSITQTLSSIVSLELSNTVRPVLDTATDSTIFHLLDIKQTGREGRGQTSVSLSTRIFVGTFNSTLLDAYS